MRRGFAEREGDSRPHNEKKKRKNQVGGSATVPLGVAEGRIGVLPITRIVDHNHRRNGHAAERIQRLKPLCTHATVLAHMTAFPGCCGSEITSHSLNVRDGTTANRRDIAQRLATGQTAGP